MSELTWNLDRIGQWSEPITVDVTLEKIAAYAEATKDENPKHRSGELAPPVFGVVGALVESIAPSILGVVPNEVAMRMVHGEQDFHYDATVAFETTSDNGNTAIKDGLAKVGN